MRTGRVVRALAAAVPVVLAVGAAAPALGAGPGRYGYDRPGDKRFVSNTAVVERYSPDGGDNRSARITAKRAAATATFTRRPVAVDGVADRAWRSARAYPIDHRFAADLSAADPSAPTSGTVRYLWDGPVLYGLVQVRGDRTRSDSGAPSWSTPSFQPKTDGLFVSMDVFDDQWGIETDTQGTFFLGADPAAAVTSYNNPGIPSLGSFFNPANQDYSTRLAGAKSSGYTPGDGVNYTYEFALRTAGWGDAWQRTPANGTRVGIELGVYDQARSFTYWSKTQAFAGQEGGSNLPNSERVRNRDWGTVTLSGKPRGARTAYSSWPADEDIRFWSSKSNPGGSGDGTTSTSAGDDSAVWTPASTTRMIAAKDRFLAIRDDARVSRARKEAAVKAVLIAFASLRWRDTRYPDPHDLPATQTVPSAFTFFDRKKGTRGAVTTSAQWQQRRREILDLAQFYEYGYKPRLGVDYTVEVTGNAYTSGDTASVTARIVPTDRNFSGGRPTTITVPLSLPETGRAPIGFGTAFRANGIADAPLPLWAFDSRTDAGAWGSPNRAGTFFGLFPYQRNSTSADSSIEIANATAVSAELDALRLAAEQNPALAARIDPSKAVTKGFSINGKNAFVAGVFDDRVKAVIAGGAGATGPANWRYNAQGQEYDFSGTAYAAPGADDVVAFGTEGPGNSYRHNRVRETELFRHFLPYGHEYAHEPGSYAYGDFGRLPFDQSLLVATLAPDRAIVIDTNLNDFNDGAMTDNASLQVAKSVWTNLGADASAFVKFNSGPYIGTGDPHGTVDPTAEGQYLSDLLLGTSTLTPQNAARLNTDPYALKVSNHRSESPYDYYWGGMNTVTGGKQGVRGTDGWAFSGFAVELAGLRAQVDALHAPVALRAEVALAGALQGAGRTSAALRTMRDVASRLDRLHGRGTARAAAVASARQLVLYLASTA